MVTLDSYITLHPLSKNQENGVLIIGRNDQFLELPLEEGLDFLKWLKSGLTLRQARARFEAKHNPFPDDEVMALIDSFLDCHFIQAINDKVINESQATLDTVPNRLAQRIFSTPVLICWMIIVIPAISLWVLTPALWPQRVHYFWHPYNAIVVIGAMLTWLIGMPLHELAHWFAARSKGIDATITWTTRMGFFPMSQTIMTNIWAVPRKARLLPIAAGMVWDMLLISLILYLLLLQHTAFISLPDLVTHYLQFYLLFQVMAVSAQFWLFSRMDGYYLCSALLGQRNLQADTYSWLKSQFSKKLNFEPPASGMIFIYLYVIITVLWGGLFLGQFLLIDIPIKIQLIWQSLLNIAGGTQVESLKFADGVAVLATQTIYYGLLVYAFFRDKSDQTKFKAVTASNMLALIITKFHSIKGAIPMKAKKVEVVKPTGWSWAG